MSMGYQGHAHIVVLYSIMRVRMDSEYLIIVFETRW